MSPVRMTAGILTGSALLAIAVPATPAPAQAQDHLRITESAAVAALKDTRLTPERDRALNLALELGPRASPELRAALIDAAWAEPVA